LQETHGQSPPSRPTLASLAVQQRGTYRQDAKQLEKTPKQTANPHAIPSVKAATL